MNPRLLTPEELKLIREYVELFFLLQVADGELDKVSRFPGAFKPFLSKAADMVHKRIHDRLVEVKRLLKDADIKVLEDEHKGDVLYFKMYFRGYEERFGVIREVLRADMEVRLAQFLKFP